jgi:hypothetical protein
MAPALYLLASMMLTFVLVQILAARKDLKVVVMSATLDAVKFQKYFEGAPLLVRVLFSLRAMLFVPRC